MKHTALIYFFLISLFFVQSCTKKEDDVIIPVATPTASLEADQIDALKWMREEEKLARDVYLHAFDIYGTQVFSNIANSEQSHMDQLLALLELFNIPDPAVEERGVFSNPEFQALYAELTKKNALSLLDAYIVGETIEDLDIRDLDLFASSESNAEILQVYDLLNCGSRNHMRSFSKQLIGKGGSYAAQYISQERYLEIIESEKEKCM